MVHKILELIDEQTSPLLVIKTVHNDNEVRRRRFGIFVSAFHIGNGYVLSVAHNLNQNDMFLKSIDENEFQSVILSKCNSYEKKLLERLYVLDNQKRYVRDVDAKDAEQLDKLFKRINYDVRIISQYGRKLYKMMQKYLKIAHSHKREQMDKIWGSTLRKVE